MAERFFKPIYTIATPVFLAAAIACTQEETIDKNVISSSETPTTPVISATPKNNPRNYDIYAPIIEPKFNGLLSSEVFTPTPLLTPTVTPISEPIITLQPTPTETNNIINDVDNLNENVKCQEILWELYDRPTFVEIPNINFSSEIQLAPIVPAADNPEVLTYKTPDEGIATPENVIANSVYIFGHSNWNNQRRPIANIENLQMGDFVKVVNENGDLACFSISDFILVNEQSPRNLRGPFDQPTVVMQTSAKLDGEIWLLDKDNVLNKVGENKPDDPLGYQALLVYGKLIEIDKDLELKND